MVNEKTKPSSSSRRGNDVYIVLLLLVVVVASVPFFLEAPVPKLEDRDVFHSLNNHRVRRVAVPDERVRRSPTKNAVVVGDANAKANANAGVIRPVSCENILNDTTIYDSNKELTKEETKRLTITDPAFYISLHSMWFDKMRWVHIMKTGEYYEKGMTSLFHDILSKYDAKERPPPLMLDIGMNIGWFSLYSHAHGHDVAAFEPNPTMFLRVCESLEHNGWTQDKDAGITLWNYGLGVTAGVFNLTLGKNPGGSSFHEERLAAKFRKTLPVSVVALDDVAVQEGWLDRRISLVKVDVEGFENFVFEGGKKLIYNGNVENILMENSIVDKTVVEGMVDMLYDAGYRIAEIRSVNGDPYHEDWWHTFNPMLEERHNSKENVESDQLNFLSSSMSNIWWQHKRIRSGS